MVFLKRSITRKNYSPNSKKPDGFGLIEAMIAGVILLITMTAIGRFTQAAMTSGSNQASRIKLENYIIDNIQEIQQQDSRLTWEAVEKLIEVEKLEDNFVHPCGNPASYLRKKLETEYSGYYVKKPSDVDRVINDSRNDLGIMTITYTFDGPENSVGNEKRVIELNPTFAANCLDRGNWGVE